MALRDNLIAWWPLDETSGNRADSHGSYTLTDNNTVTYGTGKKSNAADFEKGNSEYLSRGDSLGIGSNDSISIGGWFQTESTPASNAIHQMFSLNLYDGTYKYHLGLNYCDQGGTKRFQLYNDTGAASTEAYYNTTLSTGTFYFFLVVGNRSDNSLKMYIDNSEVISNTFQSRGTGSFGNNFYVGEFVFNATAYGRYWDGLVDELFVYNRALSTAEGAALYNSGNGLDYAGTAEAVSSVPPPQIITW